MDTSVRYGPLITSEASALYPYPPPSSPAPSAAAAPLRPPSPRPDAGPSEPPRVPSDPAPAAPAAEEDAGAEAETARPGRTAAVGLRVVAVPPLEAVRRRAWRGGERGARGRHGGCAA